MKNERELCGHAKTLRGLGFTFVAAKNNRRTEVKVRLGLERLFFVVVVD